jgi:hypothetical protein
VLQHGEPTFVVFERHAPDAVAIRFDGEWMAIERGSLVLTLETFTAQAVGRLIVGKTKRVQALGFEAVT